MANGEPSYFVKELGWSGGLEAYASLFEGPHDARAVGEKCAQYANASNYRGVPRRIARLLPDVRLIYMLRHPIDRIVSQYYMDGVKFGERRPIDVAVHDPAVFSPSLYSFQIEEYLKHFDRKQLLLLTTEDLRDDPTATLRRAFAFIGVAPDWEVREPDLALNRRGDVRGFAATRQPGEVNPAKQVLSSETRERLIERLQPDLARLPGHLGRAFDCWSLLQ